MPLPPPPPGFELDAPQRPPVGFIPGTGPAPKEATPQNPEERERTIAATTNEKLEGILKRFEIEDKRREAAERRQAKDITGELVNVIDKTARAHLISRRKPLATGSWLTSAYSKIPSSAGRDLNALLSTIGSNTAFDRLQKMREASPTGGALGSVTETELALLRDSIAALDTGQSDRAFQRNMQQIQDAYARVLVKMPGGAEALRQWRDKFRAEHGARPQPKKRAAASGWSIEAID